MKENSNQCYIWKLTIEQEKDNNIYVSKGISIFKSDINGLIIELDAYYVRYIKLTNKILLNDKIKEKDIKNDFEKLIVYLYIPTLDDFIFLYIIFSNSINLIESYYEYETIVRKKFDSIIKFLF